MRKAKKFLINSKFTISHFQFCSLYTLYSFTVFNIPLFKRFFKLLSPEKFSDFLFSAHLFCSALLLLFIFFSILFTKYTTKIFSALYLIISSFTAFFALFYGIQIDKVMIENVFATDLHEATDLFSIKMFLYVFFLGVIPAFFILFRIKIKPPKILLKVFSIIIALLASATLIFSLYFRFSTFFRVNRTLDNYFAPFNYTLPLINIVKKKVFSAKEMPDLPLEDAIVENLHQKLTLVLIVGETARRKNFSIYGYEKNTNPLLSKEKSLKILPNGISCGTSTKISVPCMFSIADKFENILITLKRLGIKIKWYDNNYGGCYKVCDTLDFIQINHNLCHGSCPDEVIFNKFFSELREPKNKQIFVLHQNGSHGPLYYRRYPEKFKKFTPQCETATVNRCTSSELINAYDNTILYTDHLIYETIRQLKKLKTPSILIYVSDHGESLGENGIFLHGFPYAIAPKEQKEIPFLIWSSEKNLIVKNRNLYHHKNLSHTIFGLMNVKSSKYNETENILAWKYE